MTPPTTLGRDGPSLNETLGLSQDSNIFKGRAVRTPWSDGAYYRYLLVLRMQRPKDHSPVPRFHTPLTAEPYTRAQLLNALNPRHLGYFDSTTETQLQFIVPCLDHRPRRR